MRAFDILPPKKVKRLTKHEKKRQKRSSMYFIFFLVLIAAFFIVFFGTSRFQLPTTNFTPTQSAPPAPEPSANSSNKIQNQVTLKILNGTGRVEESQKVQKILTDAGFTITTTENALNLYDSTIVYFQAPSENYANQIANLLSPYKAKSQKFSQETQYDIVVVIGTK